MSSNPILTEQQLGKQGSSSPCTPVSGESRPSDPHPGKKQVMKVHSTELEITQAQKIKELQDTINDLKKKLEHDEGKSQNKKDKKKDNPYETPGANELKNSKPKRTPLDIYSLPPEEITQNKRVFYHIEFTTEEARRAINPYTLRKQLQEVSQMNVKNLATDSRNGFSFEVESLQADAAFKRISAIEEQSCKVTYHKFLNQSKGIMYIRHFDFTEEFKESLKEEYPFIIEAEAATFIRTRYEGSTAILLTFNLISPPYSLYIPGESSDTTVYPYLDRPMICHNCYKYGHTKKRCRQQQICRKCGIHGHTIEECQNDFNCPNCGGKHQAGNRDCQTERDERLIKEIQSQERVGRRRAIQILKGEDVEPTEKARKFPTHFACTMSSREKRSFTPWSIEKCLSNELGSKPKSIRSRNDTEFIIEVEKHRDSLNISKIKKLNNIEVKIEECKNINQSKGLVFLSGQEPNNYQKYLEDIKKDQNLIQIEEATWIKPKNPKTKAIIMTFRENIPPKLLNVLGEQSGVKVSEYFERPMSCKRCLAYGHTEKRCVERSSTCAKCSIKGHTKNQCESDSEKCHHCEEKHPTFSIKCSIFKQEQEIIKTRTRERISRSQAIFVLKKQNPNSELNYAKALKSRTAEDKPLAPVPQFKPPTSGTLEKTPISGISAKPGTSKREEEKQKDSSTKNSLDKRQTGARDRPTIQQKDYPNNMKQRSRSRERRPDKSRSPRSKRESRSRERRSDKSRSPASKRVRK